MADGLTIVVQSEPSDKVREYGQYQFMEGMGLKPNNDIVSAPVNEDSIQLRMDDDGVFYYWDDTAWVIVNLESIKTAAVAEAEATTLKYKAKSLTSDASGIISDSSLVGILVGVVMGGSVIYEDSFQITKPINGSTILDYATNDPFLFIPSTKYFIIPI